MLPVVPLQLVPPVMPPVLPVVPKPPVVPVLLVPPVMPPVPPELPVVPTPAVVPVLLVPPVMLLPPVVPVVLMLPPVVPVVGPFFSVLPHVVLLLPAPCQAKPFHEGVKWGSLVRPKGSRIPPGCLVFVCVLVALGEMVSHAPHVSLFQFCIAVRIRISYYILWRPRCVFNCVENCFSGGSSPVRPPPTTTTTTPSGSILASSSAPTC